jgi:SAM-dependent methyltransferase
MNDTQNNEQIATIYDFDLETIFDFFLGLYRQGPGSPEATLRALSFIPWLTADSHIADLGCGTGGQTMTLAAATTARITGVDICPRFVERFNEQAWERGFAGRVLGVEGSMAEPPFAPESLDAIWCEGAIYNVGFERGLALWRPLLKPGGWVAVTENTYFTDRRPDTIERFWNAAYPEIDTAERKMEAMRRAGYRFEAAFTLGEECWTRNYYDLMPAAWEAFLAAHPDSAAARAFVEGQREERALFDHRHFGYVFYIGRRE